MNTRIPPGQGWIIEIMQLLGLQADARGVCFGLVYMAMQAFLLNDIETFKKRLIELASIDPHKLKSMIDHAYAIRKSKQDAGLPHEPTVIESILPFLEGIEFSHQAYKYPDYFEPEKAPRKQSAISSIVLPILPEELAKLGGISCVADFTGVYDEVELQDYFKVLEKKLYEQSELAVFALHSTNHVIMIGFNPRMRSWVFVDPNHLSGKIIPSFDVKKLSRMVFSSLQVKKYNIMGTQAFVTKNLELNFVELVASLNNDIRWAEIHAPTPNKAKIVDYNQTTWLHMAAINADVNTAKALIKAGASLTKEDLNEKNPFVNAVLEENVAMVNMFLAEGMDVNHVNVRKKTALHMVADTGRTKIVDVLLKNGAEVNKLDILGRTPLYYAVRDDNINIVKMLVSADADACLKSGFLDNETPFTLAVELKNIKISKVLLREKNVGEQAIDLLYRACEKNDISRIAFLLKIGVDVNGKNPRGATPLFIASQMGHQDVVMMLIARKADIDLTTNIPIQDFRAFADYFKVNEKAEKLIVQKNATDKIEITPLEVAALMDKEDVVAVLNAHANFRTQSKLGFFEATNKNNANSSNVEMISAAARLQSRPAHISQLQITDTDSLLHSQWAERRQKFSAAGHLPQISMGTEDQIDWHPAFAHLSTLHVSHKSSESAPILSFIYSFNMKDESHDNRFFMVFTERSSESYAKMMVTKYSPADYPKVDASYILINAISNSGSAAHRFGSLLVQIAVEYSLREGMEGRIKVNSTRGSGQFYYKLGFLPENLDVLSVLKNNLNCDAGQMYLPAESLNVWKKIIIKKSVILAADEIKKYLDENKELEKTNPTIRK